MLIFRVVEKRRFRMITCYLNGSSISSCIFLLYLWAIELTAIQEKIYNERSRAKRAQLSVAMNVVCVLSQFNFDWEKGNNISIHQNLYTSNNNNCWDFLFMNLFYLCELIVLNGCVECVGTPLMVMMLLGIIHSGPEWIANGK